MHTTSSPPSVSHQALVEEDLLAGKHFVLHARPDLAEQIRPLCTFETHAAVPYPFKLIVRMQLTHRAFMGRDDDVDLAESTSIQYALTWNRVINVVSGRLAAAFRQRALPEDCVFSRIAESPHQTYYFAHQTVVQGVPIQGYWVSRDQHAATDEALLVIQPVVVDLATGLRCRHRLPEYLAVPLRDSWDEAMEASAWENARAFDADKAAALVVQFKRVLAQWEPVVALVYAALTGPGRRACEQASAAAPINDMGVRQIVLGLDNGELSALAG
ncbi:MAG: hypothetical protein RLZZ618_1157 [Pseudomonadota bacterium]|jgi:hypothetical protein